MKSKYFALVLAVLVGTTTLSSCFWGRRGGGHYHHDRGYDHR
jgi:hypothetical protein